MQYISRDIFDKIIQSCTDSEIRVILYLSQRQDYFGYAPGIEQRDVCGATGICKSQFYNVKESLVRKGIVEVTETKWQKGWNFRIVNNVFRGYDEDLFKEDIAKGDKKGYVKLDKDFLMTEAFMQTTGEKEKKIALKLLSSIRESDSPVKKENRRNKKFEVYKTTVMKWVGIKSVEVLHRYIETLRNWFSIEETIEGKLHISLTKKSGKTQYAQSIKRIIHKIQVFCRKYKIKYTADAFKDTVQIIIQYNSRGINIVLSMLFDSCFINRVLEPALINYQIKKRLEEIAAQGENAASKNAPKGVKQKGYSRSLNLWYKEGANTFNNFKNREYSREQLDQILNKNEGAGVYNI